MAARGGEGEVSRDERPRRTQGVVTKRYPKASPSHAYSTFRCVRCGVDARCILYRQKRYCPLCYRRQARNDAAGRRTLPPRRKVVQGDLTPRCSGCGARWTDLKLTPDLTVCQKCADRRDLEAPLARTRVRKSKVKRRIRTNKVSAPSSVPAVRSTGQHKAPRKLSSG